ncbi:UDP-glucuronate 4-epimerase 3-like [Primulina eburnea]|uniref:UDP-glucuronate 4-epimerase 3-like n=1 Tax=Primulina eburnea TaxID=1245227 RepID=UPI003C6BFC17
MVDRLPSFHRRLPKYSARKYVSWATILAAFIIFLSVRSRFPGQFSSELRISTSWGGRKWVEQVLTSAKPRQETGHFTILVTGAAGFIGFHVSAALKQRGDGVVGLDNFNDYYDPLLKRARQERLNGIGIFVVEGDINDSNLLKELFKIVEFTHVMHLAAQAGVRYGLKNPTSYIHSNVAGFVAILEACKSANPQPAIIWASSSSVYGLNSKKPFSEADRTDQPASLYAATKKSGEEIAHAYNHIYGLSITGLRFFTVYGPWGRPDMAYFFFTKDILERTPITIFEGRNQETVARDFTYIDDIVKGCLAALDTAEKSTGSGGKKKGKAQLRVFNLGNTSPVTVKKLVRTLERLLKVKAKKKVEPLPVNGDVSFTHADISYAKKELSYRPKTDLESGLKKFVDWYMEYYDSGFGKDLHSR